MSDRGAPEAAEPATETVAPCECNITVVTFVPFLTGQLVGGPPGLAEPDGNPCTKTIGDPVPDSIAPLLCDMPVWAYSDTLASMVRNRLPHRELQVVQPPEEAPALPGPVNGQWGVTACTVDVWSFGVGLVVAAQSLGVDAAAAWSDVRNSVSRVEARRNWLGRANAIAQTLLKEHVPTPVHPALWMQAMIVAEVPRHVPVDVLDQIAAELTDHGTPLSEEQRTADTVLRLGVEVGVAANPGARALRDAVAHVVAAQTAIWAAAIELDSELGDLLRGLDRDSDQLSLKELEAQSATLLAMFERVRRFRGDVEALPIHLAGRDRSAWLTVNAEWALKRQLGALDTKLTEVEYVHGHVANRVVERRGRYLNNVVLAVTTLSAATFVLTAWEFVLKQLDAFNGVSFAVTLAALLLSVLAYLGFVFDERVRRLTRRGRRRRRR